MHDLVASFLGFGSPWPLLQSTEMPLDFLTELLVPEENRVCLQGSFGNRPREALVQFVLPPVRIL